MQAIWGIQGTEVLEFATSQIATGTVNPVHEFSIANASYELYDDVAFDRAGDLWVTEANLNIDSATGSYTGRVLEFSAAQLAALAVSPNPSPAVALTIAGASNGIAFDATGSLWVSVTAFNGSSVQKFTPAQIAASGAPSAAVTLQVSNVGSIAFGTDGTLYYAPLDVFGPSGGVIFGIAPASLAASGTPDTTETLDANGPVVLAGQLAVETTPNQIVLDGHGNLWSAFDGYYFEFSASTLHAATASQKLGFQVYPSEQQPRGQTEVISGYALAFDTSNDLIANSRDNYEASFGDNELEEFTPVQYGSASPKPVVAAFGSSVPARNGSDLGNALVAGPYVP